MGSRRWGSDLLQEAAGVNPPWEDGYTADGKIPAHNPCWSTAHNPFWSTAHNPFWNVEGLFSEKKLFQVALGLGGQDNWNSVGEMLPPAGES